EVERLPERLAFDFFEIGACARELCDLVTVGADRFEHASAALRLRRREHSVAHGSLAGLRQERNRETEGGGAENGERDELASHVRRSIRGRRSERQHAARDELVLKAERRHILDSLRIEDAVEVIALVLDDARVKAFDRAVDRSALLVEAAIAQPDIPGHETAHTGDAQAALPSLL